METTNKQLRTPAKALKSLQTALHKTEKSLLRIKAYSNELKLVTAQL